MTSTRFRSLTLSIFLTLAAPATLHADGNAEAGRVYFNTKCGGCHSLAADNNYYAPTLKCIVGRAVAAAPFSAYTDDMKAMRATGLVWTAAKLDVFLTDPKAYIARHLGKPDSIIMMQVKVETEADRSDVITYLGSRCN